MRPAPLPLVACLLPLLLCSLAAGTAIAQEAELTFFEPVRGNLAPGAQDSWEFSAPAGSMISLVAKAMDSGLDPRLEVYDAAGALVAHNDDVDWPANTDAVIEALSLPGSGRYSARVSSVGGSAGDYQLTLLQGWSTLVRDENFSDPDAWHASTIAADVYLAEGRAVLVLEAPVEQVTVTRALELPPEDYALHVEVAEIAGNRGWQLGIVSHWHSENSWLRYMVDHRGMWRVVASSAEGERDLSGWNAHPAIRADEKPGSLGLVSYGDGIELFYNHSSLGLVSGDIPRTPGSIGVYAGGSRSPGGHMTVWFRGLQITAPAQTTVGGLLPEQLPGADRQTILRNLRRQRIISGGGELTMLVPESYVIRNRAGVSTHSLGAEQPYRRYLLGASVVPEFSSADAAAGCGLMLEAPESQESQTYTLAWLDNTGSAGLSRRVGDTFSHGPVRADLQPALVPHQLLVVADEERLLFFADQQFVGQLPASGRSGTVGNAALSFANLATTCRFSDTWLWAWPGG